LGSFKETFFLKLLFAFDDNNSVSAQGGTTVRGANARHFHFSGPTDKKQTVAITKFKTRPRIYESAENQKNSRIGRCKVD